MEYEPSRLEIFLTKLAFFFYGKSVYRAFADRLPLNGGERVLDFGCGMGTVACYVAPKLSDGHLTCLDISERWLKACRKTLRSYGNVTFRQAESLALEREESPALERESFDLVYCHFVLHDIAESELARVIPVLVKSLQPGGVLVFREPLIETGKISLIRRLLEQNGLFLEDSRITDIPLLGNALENVYTKG